MIKRVLVFFLMMPVLASYSQDKFQLASPILKYESAFIKNKSTLSILFNQPGAEVRYSLNGNEPTEKDNLYKGPLVIGKRTLVKAKAFGKNYLPSETVAVEFVEDGKGIAEVSSTIPHEQYRSTSSNILYDYKGGSLNYQNGTWLGYQTDTVKIELRLSKKESVKKLLIDLLQDERSWIFLPEQIWLYYFDSQSQEFKPAFSESLKFEKQSPKQVVKKELVLNKKLTTDRLRLILIPVKQIPDWHSGKGNPAWLFIDELKVY